MATSETSNDDAGMVTGLFYDRDSAERAYRSIIDRGYDKDEINLAMADETRKVLCPENGLVTELGEKAAELGERPVSEFMTSNVESLPPSAKIAFAVHRMEQGGFRHVPVINEQGEAAGIFSVRDIVTYLTRKLAGAK